jgi:DNA-damage-inducible protein D
MKNGRGSRLKKHKNIKGLKTQNLRDHMSEAELIFTALAELSTRQIAEMEEAKGVNENAVVGKRGGGVARRAKVDFEKETGRKVVTGDSFLSLAK